MSQEKGSDAPTAIIVGGGPAGMITGLALSSLGVNVQILEQQTEDAILRPALDAEAHGLDEPLIFSQSSLQHLRTWGLSSKNERGQQVRHKSQEFLIVPRASSLFRQAKIEHSGIPSACTNLFRLQHHGSQHRPVSPQVLDLGPAARRIEYRDLRDLNGRLLRREPLGGAFCLRSSDLCACIRAAGVGAADPDRGRLDVRYGARVAHFVDISWGAAVITADSYKCAGPPPRSPPRRRAPPASLPRAASADGGRRRRPAPRRGRDAVRGAQVGRRGARGAGPLRRRRAGRARGDGPAAVAGPVPGPGEAPPGLRRERQRVRGPGDGGVRVPAAGRRGELEPDAAGAPGGRQRARRVAAPRARLARRARRRRRDPARAADAPAPGLRPLRRRPARPPPHAAAWRCTPPHSDGASL